MILSQRTKQRIINRMKKRGFYCLTYPGDPQVYWCELTTTHHEAAPGVFVRYRALIPRLEWRTNRMVSDILRTRWSFDTAQMIARWQEHQKLRAHRDEERASRKRRGLAREMGEIFLEVAGKKSNNFI